MTATAPAKVTTATTAPGQATATAPTRAEGRAQTKLASKEEQAAWRKSLAVEAAAVAELKKQRKQGESKGKK